MEDNQEVEINTPVELDPRQKELEDFFKRQLENLGTGEITQEQLAKNLAEQQFTSEKAKELEGGLAVAYTSRHYVGSALTELVGEGDILTDIIGVQPEAEKLIKRRNDAAIRAARELGKYQNIKQVVYDPTFPNHRILDLEKSLEPPTNPKQK